MYAALIEVDVTDVSEDEGLKTLMAGFKSGTWLPGNEDGGGLSLTAN